MSSPKIECPICTDEFRDTDKITITSCGHLSHSVCIKEWGRRSKICPQCHKYKPKKYKVFLSIQDHSEALPIGGNSDINVQELQEKLEEVERNFLEMQVQYNIEQDARKELEDRVASYADSENNLLLLHAQHSESEDRYKILQKEYERMAIEHAERSTEITMLKEHLEAIKLLHNAQ